LIVEIERPSYQVDVEIDRVVESSD